MIDEIMSGAGRQNILKRFSQTRHISMPPSGKSSMTKEKPLNYWSVIVGLALFAEWWKQLFGESEGKDQKGLFPAACEFTTDLHSLGQFIQDGKRLFIETVLRVERPRHVLAMTAEEQDLDGLNYLAGKTVDFINEQALRGTIMAHVEGGVPNLLLNIPELKPYYFGQMVYFFKKACAVSGYLLGVNPFDQPGVEFYKKNMFTLLGKK